MTRAEDALIASIPQRINSERISVIMMAKRELQENLGIDHSGRYRLWQSGRWCPVNLDDVMRATNRKLKAEGKQQILLSPKWEVI